MSEVLRSLFGLVGDALETAWMFLWDITRFFANVLRRLTFGVVRPREETPLSTYLAGALFLFLIWLLVGLCTIFLGVLGVPGDAIAAVVLLWGLVTVFLVVGLLPVLFLAALIRGSK